MERFLRLAGDNRAGGSYYLQDLKEDILYGHFRHKEISMTVARKTGMVTGFSDGMAKKMCTSCLISQEALAAYEREAVKTLSPTTPFDGLGIEAVYSHICSLRKAMLGVEALEAHRENTFRENAQFIAGDVDQTGKKAQLLQSAKAVLISLCDPSLAQLAKKDLQAAQGQVFMLCSMEKGNILPTQDTLEAWLGDALVQYLPVDEKGNVAYREDLQQAIDEQTALLLFYGEEGLLHCRSLLTDSVVSAKPTGFFANAVTGQLGQPQACVVYVPKGLDITRYVGLTDRTKLSYRVLASLWKAYGDSIYALTAEQLYETYPQYFLNIYETGTHCPEAAQDYPIRLQGCPMADFDRERDRAIKEYLDGFEDITYYATYFDENLNRQPICYDATQKQEGILVHAVRVKKAEKARVVSCEKTSLRQKFAVEGRADVAVLSNFLFFMTPRLGRLYNTLREDRPMEQADAAAGHLDYMLCHENGKRIETFPLFRKSCIAMKEDGSFLFFNFRLGGGSVRLGAETLRWEAEQVDTETEDIRVYTPYYSVPDGDADRNTYRKFVGAGRVNFVILRDKLCSVRRGDVILPSVGVVISLEEAKGQALIDSLGLKALEDGYFDVTGLEISVKLDAPAQVDEKTWETVKWAYGGGLSLILDGRGLCDGDHMDTWFREDGWMSPLSRQTQESALHTLVKHPRTALGVTQNGDTVLLVYSGRTWRSTGADYREMIEIARQLFPDIRSLMNMDGGGSAVLGMVLDGSFMELSCPSTSADSTVGMVRPVNTVLYMPVGQRRK